MRRNHTGVKLSETMNGYIRPRWATWLGELSAAGMTADILRTNQENRDTAPRAAFAAWLKGQRTVSAAGALLLGQRVAADARLKRYGDPLVALYASGYLSIAVACLETTIDRALLAYPNKVKVAKTGMTDFKRPAVRELEFALVAAAHLPFALAHLDEIPDTVIAPTVRAEHLAVVLPWSDLRFFDDAWIAHASRSSAQTTPPPGLTHADIEALAWSGFVNRLSLRARGDPILQVHFSVLRPHVDEYQKVAFAVPHHSPK